MTRIKTLNVVVGAERSGKSFWTDRVCDLFMRSGKFVFVYNTGMPFDYKDFSEIRLLDSKETYRYILSNKGKQDALDYKVSGGGIIYGEIDGKLIKLEKIPLAFSGKGVKSDKLFGSDGDLFFKSAFHYFYNGMLVIDDAKSVISGMSRNLSYFLSRKNHCGKSVPGISREKIGMDITVIFHNMDRVSRELFDYATHLTLFPTIQEPRLDTLDNPELEQVISQTWKRLEADRKSAAYNYDYYQIQLKNPNGFIVTKGFGRETKNI